MAQSVQRPTLDYGSGLDLTVQGFEPCIGLCTESVEPAWVFLSPSLDAPPPESALSLSVSLSKINK